MMGESQHELAFHSHTQNDDARALHFEQLSSTLVGESQTTKNNWQDMYRFDLCTKQSESSVTG